MTSTYLQQEHKIVQIAAELQDKARGRRHNRLNAPHRVPIHMINYCTAGRFRAEMGRGF